MGFVENISMLKYFLTALVINKGYNAMIEIKMFPRILESRKNLNDTWRRIYGETDKNLMNNFLEGYDKAVDKYGINEANERMREKLIETILKYQPYYTRELLLTEVSMANEYADKMTKLYKVMNDGIHLHQTEDGKYEYD